MMVGQSTTMAPWAKQRWNLQTDDVTGQRRPIRDLDGELADEVGVLLLVAMDVPGARIGRQRDVADQPGFAKVA
jgi:hypothetical protein